MVLLIGFMCAITVGSGERARAFTNLRSLNKFKIGLLPASVALVLVEVFPDLSCCSEVNPRVL